MNRRDFLTTSALASAASLAVPGLAFAAEKNEKSANPLLDAATDCNKKAELCLEHCMESLSTGSKAMAECAASVRDMMIYCEALAKASARGSKHLRALAKIAGEACKECEAQCRKHKQMQVCLDCANACATCAKECASA